MCLHMCVCVYARVCVCVSLCVYARVCVSVCVSYRPRSGLFPQEVGYSPQANQRTKFETEFNPIGPTLATFMTQGANLRGADGQQGDDITAGMKQ